MSAQRHGPSVQLTRDLDELRLADVGLVGGKNASLGELRSALRGKGIRIPDGFALTSQAYWHFLKENGLQQKIEQRLSRLQRPSYGNLHEIGSEIRTLILAQSIPPIIAEAISSSYRALIHRAGREIELAVRSSATAEDLPTASFAGQQESYLNVRGEAALIEACHRCYASLYTDRAIKYREDNQFEHTKVALSVGVQAMVRSDLAASGVAFTVDPETGHDGVILISGSWGLGENIVQGAVNPDEFCLFKRALREGKRSTISHALGSKAKTMVYAEPGSPVPVINVNTPRERQIRYVLTDDEIESLGRWLLAIEEHYGRAMDVEWAKDGITDGIYIVQARPETVHSQRRVARVTEYKLRSKGRELAKGEGLGSKIVAGKARILADIKDGASLRPGEIIVTSTTNPDWDPLLKRAAGIITDRGGRTSHAAIVARELGTCAVVGCGTATKAIVDGQDVTIVTSQGESGIVYEGQLSWDAIDHELAQLPRPRTKIMLILADPGNAFRLSQYPVDGVGLLRMEFAINNSIKIHPMALAHPERVANETDRRAIAGMTEGYESGKAFFIEKLSEAVATIGAAFYPRDVIVRMSDFKTNEYANLIGGRSFEPQEENPMLGFRGASRYTNERYCDGFDLECLAMARVRDDMGLTNVKLMIPFCRTIEEGKKVIERMEANGLVRGRNDLEIYVMAEIPSNVILAEQFAEIFDGFSIGSNDLTQLTLGIDRDSELVRHLFDENDEAVTTLITQLIEKAHLHKRHAGLCGQAPSDHPEFAKMLVENGIDSISFNPDAVFRGIERTYEAELLTARVIGTAAMAELSDYE